MNYTRFMTFTHRPMLFKNKVRPASLGRGHDANASAPAVGTAQPGKRSFFGQAKDYSGAGPTALAGDIVKYDIRQVPGLLRGKVLRKRIQRGVELVLARASIRDDALQAIVERKVEEALAQRIPAMSPAVASARERGATWASEEYANPENWSLDQAAGAIGISARVINERRNAWRYYALVPKGQQRGFRFPKWQFDAESSRLEAILAVLRDASAGCWTVHIFMVTPNSQLNGMSPRDWILDPQADLERLLQIARARFTSDQGAG